MSTLYRIVHRYNMIVQTYCLNCSWLLYFKQYQFSEYAWISNLLALGKAMVYSTCDLGTEAHKWCYACNHQHYNKLAIAKAHYLQIFQLYLVSEHAYYVTKAWSI
jgi:hypothetical protein